MIWFILLAAGCLSFLGGIIGMTFLCFRFLKRYIFGPGLVQEELSQMPPRAGLPLLSLFFLLIIVGALASLLAIERIEAMP